ncbi:macrophage mannose receptor 1-like [Simochromis diagramma]|uniref:macrophage mannose receptor 1-like n=1 Tax=Simochromis diagramma TaxID=43689 RepID=UPI001A7EF617|nr:macrophage mannose receptor 1-like [Simochromis diagramma]
MEKVFLLIVAASGLCSGSSYVKRQYHFVYDWKNWTDAQSYCRERHTDLATIENMEDVRILQSMADSSKMNYGQYPNRAWIGLYDDMNSWRWSMSNTDLYKNSVAFRNWEPGQPDNRMSKEHCTGLRWTGSWTDENCNNTFKALCSDIRGLNVTFVFINKSMTWMEAQSYCRANYTDLASVRNMSENQKAKELVPAGQSAWIGLFRDSWKWMDGSNFSFTYWNTNEPNNVVKNEFCVAANFGSTGKWEDWNCDRETAFVCYNEPAYKQVVRLRMGKNNNQDLNDPAVMEAMLEQFKQKLKNKGVKGDIRLSWRKQSDGEVFLRDEKQTKKNTTSKNDF